MKSEGGKAWNENHHQLTGEFEPTRALQNQVKSNELGKCKIPTDDLIEVNDDKGLVGNYNRFVGKLFNISAYLFCGIWQRKTNNESENHQVNLTSQHSSQKISLHTKLKPTIDRKVRKVENEDRDVDGGYAWIVLAVIFVINASTFGTARTYGLIFERLAREHEQNRANAALPFTIMGAVENMAGPFAGYLLTKTNSFRFTVITGCCLISGAHFLAAYLDTLVGQILSMGLMCGLGLSLVTISFFQINNTYFVRYRSRAFGLGLTGAVFGTMYISPLCQYVLDNFDIGSCYIVLGLILSPSIPLASLLKQKNQPSQGVTIETREASSQDEIHSVSKIVQGKEKREHSVKSNILLVVMNPMFHLIWPTQLLFCWFNFVYGMIIVDFGKDRGLDSNQVSQLVPVWALGQLLGRMFLGSLVDLKMVSYETFTVICISWIGVSTYLLNNLNNETHNHITIPISTMILSMCISNLYILFNSLIVKHMDKSLSGLSVGISSFAGSFFLLPRASVIGYYRDTNGNYDGMLTMFAYVSLAAAMGWLLLPIIGCRLQRIYVRTKRKRQIGIHLSKIDSC